MKSLGVDATVLGSYTDEDLGFLTEAASQADVVFAIVRLELYSFFIIISWSLVDLLIRPTQG